MIRVRPALPFPVRVAAVAAVLLSTCVSTLSLYQLGLVSLTRDELTQGLNSGLGDPRTREPVNHFFIAQFDAMQPFNRARGFTLGALAFASSLTFIAAARVLRPGALPREGMRRLLVLGTLVSAVLRTVDGAEQAAANRKANEVVHSSPLAAHVGAGVDAGAVPGAGVLADAGLPRADAELEAITPGMVSDVFEVLFNVVSIGVVALFGVLFLYFGSERMKAAIRSNDARLEP